MQVSFKLGLRAQEIALLQIKEIAQLDSAGKDLKILEVMSLPAAYTKGSDAMGRSKINYERKRISFDIHAFNQVVKQIAALAKSGAEIHPENFYPAMKKYRGKSRDLPLVDSELRVALAECLRHRISIEKALKPSPLFL